MAFNARNAVKKERKFGGKIFKLQDRLSTHDHINNIHGIEVKLKKEGYYVRSRPGVDEWGYKIVDVYIRRK